jgi:hypothetical protein
MGYVLPRGVLVLLGWGVTYFILTALSTHLAPSVIYITGIAWVLAGVVCFGYLYKLRREMGFPLHRPIAALHPSTRKPAAPEPTILARLRALPPRRRTAA